MRSYILNQEKEVIPCSNMDVFDKWFENMENRRVANTKLNNGFLVSTVFLGIDYRFMGLPVKPGPPLVFETMVFQDKVGMDLDMDRYRTWEEAVAGHDRMCAKWKDREKEWKHED